MLPFPTGCLLFHEVSSSLRPVLILKTPLEDVHQIAYQETLASPINLYGG